MKSWRDRIAVAFGPGLFAGVTCGDWWRMLRENRYAIHPRYWLRAAVSSQLQFAELNRRQEGFEDLESDPIAVLRTTYDALDLPDFGHVEPRLNVLQSIRQQGVGLDSSRDVTAAG